jgi:hypothetical protein
LAFADPSLPNLVEDVNALSERSEQARKAFKLL